MTDLNRYKGQFIRGNTKRIKPPRENDIVHYDLRFQVLGNGIKYNGWIPPRKGAI